MQEVIKSSQAQSAADLRVLPAHYRTAEIDTVSVGLAWYERYELWWYTVVAYPH